jgi:arylsulfatase
MEVYAAMLDNMDQGIGRIVAALEETGRLDNTLIFYLQDNGACAERYGFYRSAEELPQDQAVRPMAPNAIQTKMVPDYTRDGVPVRVAFGVMPGPADTYVGYAQDWANASNTPFRMFKHWSHEGGISTPLIVHWPAGIGQRGTLRSTPGHLIDIMATCVAIAGAEYPTVYNGNPIQPLEGMSLVPVFDQDTLERAALYWEHEGNRAIRLGKWKLVNRPYEWPLQLDTLNRLPLDMWELYDMEADRTETFDLAEVFPERVQEMASLWQAWADRVGAVPKPPDTRRASRHYENPVPVTN